MRSTVLCLTLAFLCAAGSLPARAGPTPLAAWSSGTYLSRSSDPKAVASAQALEELFDAVAGTAGSSPAALHGLLDASQLAEQRPDAVVVVASAATGSPAVAQAAEQLTGAATSHMQLLGASHEGGSHPVFAALRRSARGLRVRVLGHCASTVAAAGPATSAALRAELEGAAGGDKPVVVVLCPGADEDAGLLAAAAQLLAELAPRHLLLHAGGVGGDDPAAPRRRLLAVARDDKPDAANRTQNYTVCDATCHKHVMWFQGLIVFVVILLALCVGCSCMHMVDVPSRFAQPEGGRAHQD